MPEPIPQAEGELLAGKDTGKDEVAPRADLDLWTAGAIVAAIRAHGEDAYPHECCGALVGKDRRVTAVVPLPNTTEEGPRRRFLVRPSDYRLAEARASEFGGDLLGFYHSHPDHPARPSEYDLAHAWPTFAYVIVSVASGAAGDLTVWWLKDDRTTFIEGTLSHGDENPDSHSPAAVHG